MKMDLSREEIKLVEEHRKEQAEQAKKAYQPKLADQWTDKEKCSIFDVLHSMALERFETIRRDGWCDGDDAKTYIYQRVMEMLSNGPIREFWKAFNAMQ